MIESFFSSWYTTWAFAGGIRKFLRIPEASSEDCQPNFTLEKTIPPYVEILVSHTRLSTYGSVINHPTAPADAKRFFHAAGLSSALNVMRAAVQGEGRLKSMPNNTTIMISFAACFALRLSVIVADKNSSLVPSIKILIEETADVLERIGNIPSHRKGTSALFGRHLREVVRNSATSLGLQEGSGRQELQNLPLERQSQAGGYIGEVEVSSGERYFEPLLFSAMSDDQIVEVINNARDGIDSWLPNAKVDDNSGMDWLDWFGADFVP
jgi:hypothetical protein